jgi:CheY-like chemotaxis protein
VKYDDLKSSHPLFSFAVEDTGIGISEKALPFLFDKFTQADASTTRTYGGTGLGLAISKQLVQLMQGRIEVSSTLGVGSIFSFTLPLQPDRSAPFLPISRNSLLGARVLVVDHSPLYRRIVAEQLSASRGETVCVPSASEALIALRAAKLAGRPFHIVILDNLMPDMDGETFAREIKGDPRFAPTLLLMLTSSPQKSDRARFQAAGFSAYLVKPTRQALLHETLVTLWSTIVDERSLSEIVTRRSLAEVRIGKSEPPLQSGDRLHSLSSRVLIADDNPLNQKLAKRLLERAGCSVDVASNGRQAVEMWQEFPYDLIFMDCQMPTMDGYEATREIRRQEQAEMIRNRIPIVAMTANTMSGDREKCLIAGMDDFIPKPIPSNAIDRVLHRWAESSNPLVS